MTFQGIKGYRRTFHIASAESNFDVSASLIWEMKCGQMPDTRFQNNTWVACGVSYPNNDLNHIDFSAVSRWWGTGKCRVVLVPQPYRAYSV
jgi:hypothetical protein